MGLLDLSVSGNMAILSNLDALSSLLQEGVQKKLEEAGQVALETAQELVPVDTGYLKSTLYTESQPGEVKVGADASYAVYQELGFHHYGSGTWVPAQPFLIPGMEIGAQYLKDSLPGLI